MKPVLSAFFGFLFATPAVITAQTPPDTPPPTYSIAGSILTVTLDEETTSVELPCEGESFVTSGETLYVACGTAGVAVVSIAVPTSPEPLELRAFAEPVTRVFVVGEEVWAQIPSTISKPLSRVGPAPTLAEARTPKEEQAQKPEPREQDEPMDASEVPVGEVIEIGVGEVTVDLGQSDGLVRGDRVDIFVLEAEQLGPGEDVQKERRLSIGTVESASENRARVRLGLNEEVRQGALARETTAPVTGSLISPRRYGGIWEVFATTRPFLALGTLGGGGIIDASLTYRLESPVAFDVILSPFGFGIAEAGNILTFAGNALVSYDTTPFQIGLGAGVSKINTLPASRFGEFVPADEEPSFRAGFSAAQYVRLGARDGLHLTVLNNFILFDEEFRFGGLTGEAQIPVRLFVDYAWLVARGGGGIPGYGFGEFGIRLLAVGNGGPGSVFLTPTIGGGVLFGDRYTECQAYYDETFDEYFVGRDPRPGSDEAALVDGFCREQYSYGGPLVGFGVEWRM